MFQADIGRFVDLAKLLYQQSIEELSHYNGIKLANSWQIKTKLKKKIKKRKNALNELNVKIPSASKYISTYAN